MKDISAILYSLGFLESEVKTYLAALAHGPRTVLELTKLTKLSRQATYVVIESLTGRGLMSSVLRGKKRYYVAEDPDKVLSYAQRKEHEMRERISDLEHMLPELKLRMGGEKPTVRLFEGIEGLKTVIENIADAKPEYMYEIADLEALFTIIKPEELSSLVKKLKRVNTKVWGIYSGTPAGKTLQSNRIFLPKELSNFKSSIGVFGNKVCIMSYEGKMHSVIIENETITKVFILLLKLATKGAREYPSD
jgi:sugar-specific transcriptional regulator TrmB